MKKKLLIILPILIAIATFVGVFFYFNYEDSETSLTITEKRWLEENAKTKVNFEIINDLPLFGMNGDGVLFQFLGDFETATGLEFNKIPYLKTGTPSDNGYRIRILNNEDTLTNKDILIAEDNYIMVAKEYEKIDNLTDLKDKKIGALATDYAEVVYYLKSATNIEVVSYDTVEEMSKALDNDTINAMIMPKIAHLDKTISSSGYTIIYSFTEFSKKIVLTLSDKEEDSRLNEILSKYFDRWQREYYVSSYNRAYLNYYIDQNKINDKTRADLISKNYVYGYVENAPYEVTMDEKVNGIAGEYVDRMARLTGIDFTYRKYDTMEELKNAISQGEVDLYFNYDGSTNEHYQETVSTFIERYVVLGKPSNEQTVTSFESLKNQKVNMIKNNALFRYFKDNSRAEVQEFTEVQDLTSNSNLIVVDREVYMYYKNSIFSDYEVLYENSMTNEYNFMVKNDDQTFYDLFNHIINTNSYYNYRNAGLNSLNKSLLERTTFEQLYFIVLGAILLPILVIIAIYLYLKKKKKVKEVRKEDRRKYTDMLTSLKNRNYLNLNIASWDDNQVYPQSIVIIDLNNVKYVNDNYGHEAGDELIIKAAGILVNTQLENSEIIRTDGNEFLIYLVGYSEQQVSTYTKKLTKELKELPHGFGAAVGFSMITDDIKMIDDAINEATLAMREHKEDYK